MHTTSEWTINTFFLSFHLSFFLFLFFGSVACFVLFFTIIHYLILHLRVLYGQTSNSLFIQKKLTLPLLSYYSSTVASEFLQLIIEQYLKINAISVSDKINFLFNTQLTITLELNIFHHFYSLHTFDSNSNSNLLQFIFYFGVGNSPVDYLIVSFDGSLSFSLITSGKCHSSFHVLMKYYKYDTLLQ